MKKVVYIITLILALNSNSYAISFELDF